MERFISEVGPFVRKVEFGNGRVFSVCALTVYEASLVVKIKERIRLAEVPGKTFALLDKWMPKEDLAAEVAKILCKHFFELDSNNGMPLMMTQGDKGIQGVSEEEFEALAVVVFSIPLISEEQLAEYKDSVALEEIREEYVESLKRIGCYEDMGIVVENDDEPENELEG